METKICPKCGPKPINDFNWRNKDNGIRCNECRECHSAYNKANYKANKDVFVKRNTERKNRVVADAHDKIETYLQEHPCVDCGETDTIVLEFDHRPGGVKVGDVSKMVSTGYRWETILIEIEKCDVRCANDHRRKTAERGKWYTRGDSNS